MKKIGKNTKLYLIGMIIGGITLGITTVIADTIINSTSVAYKTTTVKAALDELYDIADFKQEVKDMLYPVGSIYISVSSTNPSQLFGGTWVRFGEGRTLMGVGTIKANSDDYYGSVIPQDWSKDSSEYTAGSLFKTLSVDEMPAHSHNIETNYSGWKLYYTYLEGTGTTNPVEAVGASTSGTHFFKTITGGHWLRAAPVGNGQRFSLIQPIITVYMWKRTA